VNSRHLIALLYLVLLAGIGFGAGAMLLEARAEHKQLKLTEAASQRRLAEARAELARQKQILERLRNDPAYVEKILRQRTYARPGEVIFRFEN
jgi:cell division protein FtsB